MSEEKKEIKPEDTAVEKPSEAPKQEAPKAEAPKAGTPTQESVKTETPKADVGKKEEKKIEKPANCSVCNKSIKKKRYYYRNGKYFCNLRCFKTTVKKESVEGADKASQAEVK